MLQPCPTEDLPALGTFIRSVRFRFIPNHVQPSEVLDREVQTLRRAINRRVRARAAFRGGGVDEARQDLGSVTQELFEGLSESVVRYTPELSAVSADIPHDFADLAFQLGFSPVTSQGTSQPTILQGSGTQSFLLLHVLDLVDQSAFEVDFGWTKAVVWAIDGNGVPPPRDVAKIQFASDLAGFSDGKRRQVFVTTHESEFQRVAEHVWLARREGAPTSVHRMSARDGIREASRLRVSSYEHPLFLSADRPLVLAEGPTDVAYLTAASEAEGLRPAWVLSSVPTLDPTQSGGDATIIYLSVNASVLASRPLHAPVVVVRDWEDSPASAARHRKVVSTHETSVSIKMPETCCNPQLGQKFRGIERYLPTAIVEEVLRDDLRPKSMTEKYPLHIEKADLDAKKNELLAAVAEADDPGEYLRVLVVWLNEQVAVAVGTAPSGSDAPSAMTFSPCGAH